jgi:hypothetical protein
MNETFSRRVLVLVFALAGVVPARSVLAQTHSAVDVAQARELFNAAMDLREKGNATLALEKFRAAHALAVTPITGLELGRTYMALGKLVEARETFLSVARIAPEREETSRSTAARKASADFAEQLRPRIPSLVVHIIGVPEDSVAVTIDGASVPTAALVAPRLVDPGSHRVVAATTSGGNAETTIELKEGETRNVELKIVLTGGTPPPAVVAPPAAARTSPPIQAPAESTQATPASTGLGPLAYGGFGVAAVGIVAGTVTGVMSLSRASAVKNACDGMVCPRSVDGDLSSGRALGTVSTISFAVAGAGAVAGVIGLLIRPHQEQAPTEQAWVVPWIGAGSAGLSGEF